MRVDRQSIDQLRANIERSGEVGQLVAANYKSTMLLVPLLTQDAAAGTVPRRPRATRP